MARKKQLVELEGLYRSELEFLIKELTVGAFAYRNKRLLRDVVIEGHEYQPMAEKYDISETRAKTIVRKFCKNVKDYREKHPEL